METSKSSTSLSYSFQKYTKFCCAYYHYRKANKPIGYSSNQWNWNYKNRKFYRIALQSDCWDKLQPTLNWYIWQITANKNKYNSWWRLNLTFTNFEARAMNNHDDLHVHQTLLQRYFLFERDEKRVPNRKQLRKHQSWNLVLTIQVRWFYPLWKGC